MEQYLIDTNIVSDYFSASLPIASFDLMDTIIDAVPNLSVITQIELLCWKTNKEIANKIESFISDSIIVNLSSEVIAHCVTIRRDLKIKLPDAIIAASAIANGYILITNNEKDFSRIKGLKILNPHKL